MMAFICSLCERFLQPESGLVNAVHPGGVRRFKQLYSALSADLFKASGFNYGRKLAFGESEDERIYITLVGPVGALAMPGTL